MNKLEIINEIDRVLKILGQIREIESKRKRIPFTPDDPKLKEKWHKEYKDENPLQPHEEYPKELNYAPLVLGTLGICILPGLILGGFTWFLSFVLGLGVPGIVMYIASLKRQNKVSTYLKSSSERIKNEKKYLEKKYAEYRQEYYSKAEMERNQFKKKYGGEIAMLENLIDKSTFIPKDLRYNGALLKLKEYLVGMRADTLKEAINLYHFEKKNAQLREEQDEKFSDMKDEFDSEMAGIRNDYEYDMHKMKSEFESIERELEDLKYKRYKV